MTNNAITLLVKKEVALDIIDLMRTGKAKSLKEACEMMGIDERAFHNTIGKFPEIAETLTEHQRARISTMWEQIVEDTVKNAEALSEYAQTLRARMEAGLLADGAVKTLISIDKHNQKTMEILKTVVVPTSGNPAPGAQSPDAAAANKILASMQGAKRVTAEFTVESYRVTLGGEPDQEENPDVVNGEVTETSERPVLPAPPSQSEG